MQRYRLPALAGACLVLSVGGFACGSDRSARDVPVAPAAAGRPGQAGDQPTNIVSNADIRRTRPHSPGRSILTWAQAIQFEDLPAVDAAYTRRVRRTATVARLQAAAKVIAAQLGRPEIVNTAVRGTRARVRVALISYAGDGRRSEQPTTFGLRREDGRWRLDDAALLLDTAAALRRQTG
ncbi:MAG: hypothetical protein QOG42_1344 [Solirubrobacteraceae bacterium]|nr:hypothetical protein [Solirubrobacteraceae bacterium]